MDSTENIYLERTFTVLKNERSANQDELVTSLSALDDEHAIVVLGEPGAGKSECFNQEYKKIKNGFLISARDFITLKTKPEWSEYTIFIDGLDEKRASNEDGNNALDAIRTKLDELGSPKFRLSCRAADWYGDIDREALKMVSGNKSVKVLLINPLTEDDQLKYVSNKIGEEHAQSFLEKSKNLGLSEWLTNPQTLNLLLDAVGKDGSNWPATRQETFNLAIRKMVAEENKQHRKSQQSKNFSTDSLTKCAGLICATLLLADIAYVAIDEGAVGESEVCINDLCNSELSLEMFRAVIRSRLFVQVREEVFSPVHRSVSEYLAGRFIAGQMNDSGLPLDRVLSLIVGVKGSVVTGLRGLYAWLAVFVGSSRQQLIQRDPLGLILYGDVQYYPVVDKELLLLALKNSVDKKKWLDYHYSDNHKFAALVTGGMTEVINNIFSKKNPDNSWQHVMVSIVDGLRHSNGAGSHLEDLIRIIRDEKYISVLRRYALYTITKLKTEQVLPKLKDLLQEIQTGKIVDEDDELSGELLTALFPGAVDEHKIFDYLHTPKKSHFIGSFHMFWAYGLLTAPGIRLPILLEELQKRKLDFTALEDSLNFGAVITKLVALAVEKHGSEITIDKLYYWLGFSKDEGAISYTLEKENHAKIRKWFTDNPHKCFELTTYSIESIIDHGKIVWPQLMNVKRNLADMPEPDGFGEWCLSNAAITTNASHAEAYFESAILSFASQSKQRPFDLDKFTSLAEWVDQHPGFSILFNRHLSSEVEEWRLDSAKRSLERKIEKLKTKNEWLEYINTHWPGADNPQAPIHLLYNLARVHTRQVLFDRDAESDQLRYLFDEDDERIQTLLEMISQLPYRSDLPTIKESAAISADGKANLFYVPSIVGLKMNPIEVILQLPDEVLSKLIAIKVSSSSEKDEVFDRIKQEKPELYGNVLAEVIEPYLKKDGFNKYFLGNLAYNEEDEAIAKVATPLLLKSFPKSIKSSRIEDLKYLLISALKYLNHDSIEPLVFERLTMKLNIMQRVYWLCAGALINPNRYLSQLIDFVADEKSRIHSAYDFFSERDRDSTISKLITESVLAWLVEKNAKHNPPFDRFESTTASSTRRVMRSDVIRGWINKLGSMTTLAAEQHFIDLINNPGLRKWLHTLQVAAEAQKVLRNDFEHKVPKPTDVIKTLNNLEPANVHDLFAITVSHLKDLREKIRSSATNDYKQYWSFDERNKRLTASKPENDCRDALLSDLNVRLDRLHIEAIKEGYYADEKRADIRVSYMARFNIPIEIKKDKHKELWSAGESQLVKKYMREAQTGGFGVYVVLWFGGEGMPINPHYSISSAQELETALKESLKFGIDGTVDVIVFDCSLREP